MDAGQIPHDRGEAHVGLGFSTYMIDYQLLVSFVSKMDGNQRTKTMSVINTVSRTGALFELDSVRLDMPETCEKQRKIHLARYI